MLITNYLLFLKKNQVMAKTIILNDTEINQKIKRIAFQIYESNVNEKEVIIAGIEKKGYILAEKIAADLEKIAPLKVSLCSVNINKENVFEPIKTSLLSEIYQNKSLILVDDVLHTGTTLMYTIKHFLNIPLKQFRTAVLVDRNHKKFPVKVDFKGISLSTSFQNNVVVILKNDKSEAYLE